MGRVTSPASTVRRPWTMSSRVADFGMKPAAPHVIALCTTPRSAKPDTITMGSFGERSAQRDQSLKPMRVGEPEGEVPVPAQSVPGKREAAGVDGAGLGQALANGQLQPFREDRVVLDDQELGHWRPSPADCTWAEAAQRSAK